MLAAGNCREAASLTILHRARPGGLPRPIPHWAGRLLRWQVTPVADRGARPAAPKRLPAWYRRWAGWRLNPYRIAG